MKDKKNLDPNVEFQKLKDSGEFKMFKDLKEFRKFYGLSNEEISKVFNYSGKDSFNNSTAKKRVLVAVMKLHTVFKNKNKEIPLGKIQEIAYNFLKECNFEESMLTFQDGEKALLINVLTDFYLELKKFK